MGASIGWPIAPDISGIDPLRCLVLAPIGIARRLRLVSGVTPVGTVLAVVVLPLRARGIPRSGNIPAVAIVIVIPAALLVPVAVGVRCHAVVAARVVLPVNIPARDQLILGIEDVTAAVDAEAFGDRPSAAKLHFAGLQVDRFACEMAFGLGRRRGERGFGCNIGPGRLDDGLEDRHRDVTPSRTTAEGAPL